MKNFILCFLLMAGLVLPTNLTAQRNAEKDAHYAFKNDKGKYGYKTKYYKVVIKPRYDEADNFGYADLARIRVGKKVGYINPKGKEVIKPKYDSGSDFAYSKIYQRPVAIVYINDRCGLIDETGNEIISLKYDDIYPYGEGFAPHMAARLNNNRIIIDTTGIIITAINNGTGQQNISALYDEIIDMQNGYRRTMKNKKFGITQSDLLKVVAVPKYDNIIFYSNHSAVVEINNKAGLIDLPSGAELLPPVYDSIVSVTPDYAIVWSNTGFGLFNKKTKERPALDYTYIADFKNGLAKVNIGGKITGTVGKRPLVYGGKWGYINKTGKVVVPARYDDVGSYTEQAIAVRTGDKWGFVDWAGKEIIPQKYESIDIFSEGKAGVKLNGKWGYIDRSYREIIAPKYEMVYAFNKGMAKVKQNGLMGLINEKGETIVPSLYDYIGDIVEEGYITVTQGKLTGLVRMRTGEEIVAPRYQSIGNFHEGLAVVQRNGLYGYMDIYGRELIEPRYAYASSIYMGEASVKDKNPGTMYKIKKPESPELIAAGRRVWLKEKWVGQLYQDAQGLLHEVVDYMTVSAPANNEKLVLETVTDVKLYLEPNTKRMMTVTGNNTREEIPVSEFSNDRKYKHVYLHWCPTCYNGTVEIKHTQEGNLLGSRITVSWKTYESCPTCAGKGYVLKTDL